MKKSILPDLEILESFESMKAKDFEVKANPKIMVSEGFQKKKKKQPAKKTLDFTQLKKFQETVKAFIENPGKVIYDLNYGMASMTTSSKLDVQILTNQMILLQKIIVSFFLFYNWFFLIFYNPLHENVTIFQFDEGDNDPSWLQFVRFFMKFGLESIVYLQSCLYKKVHVYATDYKMPAVLMAVLLFATNLFFVTQGIPYLMTTLSFLIQGKTNSFISWMYVFAVCFFFGGKITLTFIFALLLCPVTMLLWGLTKFIIGMIVWIPIGGSMLILYILTVSVFGIKIYSPDTIIQTIDKMNTWITTRPPATDCPECDTYLSSSLMKMVYFMGENMFPLSLIGYFLHGCKVYFTTMETQNLKMILICTNILSAMLVGQVLK